MAKLALRKTHHNLLYNPVLSPTKKLHEDEVIFVSRSLKCLSDNYTHIHIYIYTHTFLRKSRNVFSWIRKRERFDPIYYIEQQWRSDPFPSLQERVKQRGRKRSQDLWPQAKQVELTLGRRWRCPNDFFNDEMIAEVLSSQAEVIRGRALG